MSLPHKRQFTFHLYTVNNDTVKYSSVLMQQQHCSTVAEKWQKSLEKQDVQKLALTIKENTSVYEFDFITFFFCQNDVSYP
jgi:hypothetical protein